MTVEELINLLDIEDYLDELYVCHYAKRAGQVKPIINNLAEVRWISGKLCLIEEDDRKLYLAAV